MTTPTPTPTISLNLVVDREKNRVLFAESGKEFVDILFSFLTLPMGTVIRVLDKQSSVGCMDSLYQSIEKLDARFLQTFSCKEMLLQPRCHAELDCEYLKIKVDELHPGRYYSCSCPKFAHVSGVYCCGKVMQKNVHSAKGKSGGYDDGVFVKGRVWFLICDDLHVIKATTGSTISLLQKLGIKNADVLERKTVEFGRQEVLNLLKRSLVSKSPLTDVFLQKEHTSESLVEEIELIDIGNIKSEKDFIFGSSKLHIKLFKSDATGESIFAEAEKEFGDFLFSFLTFPLGSIVKLLNKNSFRGSIDQLYTSVENLGVGDCIKCNKSLLLDPKLPIYFGCSGSLLKIDEGSSLHHGVYYCGEEINPKLPVPGKEKGGGFAKEFIKYTFTDECDVSIIFSPISAIEMLKGLNVPIDRLVEKHVAVGELEALKLLKACITSRSALNSVFSPETKSKTQGAKS